MFIYVCKDKYLECIEKLYWFRTVAEVGSPIGSTAGFTVLKLFLSSVRQQLVAPKMNVSLLTFGNILPV